MSVLDKIQPSFDSFQMWCAKHLPLDDLTNETIIQERKNTIKVDCFFEFRSEKECHAFIQQYDKDWQNPLDKSEINSNTRSTSINSGSNQAKDFIFIIKFLQLPILWIRATYRWIEQNTQDNRLERVHGNKPMYLCLNEINEFFEIEHIHNSFYGFSGKNTVVGLIDSGIDQTHPDLKDRVIDGINITEEESTDLNGHGTVLASVIAGSGLASERLYHGIAPDSKLLDIKVSNQFGCITVADVMLALDFLLSRNPRNFPQVLVFGCATAYIPNHFDPLIQYCSLLSKENILIIGPIGNYGPDFGYIGSPALSQDVLSVGTIDFRSKMAFFCSRGFIDKLPKKPDLLAPGIKIVAAKALKGKIGLPYSPNENYIINSGSSISAVVVAGLCALLIEAFPSVSMKELRDLLINSTGSMSDSKESQSGIIPNVLKILHSSNLMFNRPTTYKILMNNAKWGTALLMMILIMVYLIITFLF